MLTFSRILLMLLTMMAAQTFFSLPFLVWQEAVGSYEIIGGCLSLVVAGVLLFIALRFGNVLEELTTKAVRVGASIKNWQWITVIVAAGILLRVAWMLVFPAQPTSDGRIYLELADLLCAGERYEIGGARAYWPPGYPLFLSLWFRLLSPSLLVVKLVNLFLFVGTVLVVFCLAKKVANDTVARLSILLLAIWPSYLTLAGLPSKELVLIFIVPCIIFIFFGVAMQKNNIFQWTFYLLSSGVITGAASLIQPSMLLFPVALFIVSLFGKFRPCRIGVQLCLVLVGMTIVIAPWTIRNYRVFGQFVLISSNGGSNLYRANNPLATGGYMSRGEIDISGYDELSSSKLGFKHAKTWILENSGAFLLLSLQKQIRFLGDDSVGVYGTLRRSDSDMVGTRTYYALKGFANLFWLVVWMCIVVGILRLLRSLRTFRDNQTYTMGFILISVAILYFYGLHSVFESSSKYHMPLVGIFAILASMISFEPKVIEDDFKE